VADLDNRLPVMWGSTATAQAKVIYGTLVASGVSMCLLYRMERLGTGTPDRCPSGADADLGTAAVVSAARVND